MSDASDRTAALARLTQLVQPAVEPVLTTGSGTTELETILDKHRRATTYAPGTYYAFGQIVLPTVRNGRKYRCVQAGLSDAASPATVVAASVTNGGTGYTSAPTVSLSGGGGSGGAAIALLTAGVVTAVVITNKGSGYTSAPTISFTGGGGSGAVAATALIGNEPFWPTRNGARVTDGTADPLLTWEEFGPDFDNIYDVRAAAHEAWLLKAEKCSNNFTMKLGSLGFSREQIHEHCLNMAQQFAPLNFG